MSRNFVFIDFPFSGIIFENKMIEFARVFNTWAISVCIYLNN